MKTTNSLEAKTIRQKYTSEHTLKNGDKVVLRPIECNDKERFKEFFRSLSPVSVHFRFFEVIKELPNEEVERYCNIDYKKEIAIVAQLLDDGRIVAVARLAFEWERRRGEFAVVVADAWQGLGLGAKLMGYVVGIACDLELVEIHYSVSSDNSKMIALSAKMGAKVKSSDTDTVEMTLPMP